jgi:hypothetical protein
LSSKWHRIVPNGMLPWNLPMKMKSLSTKIIPKILQMCQSKQLYYAFKKSMSYCLDCANTLCHQQWQPCAVCRIEECRLSFN